MKAVDRFCELCNGQASVFCPSDAAFLCWGCDARVHQANFLVARHVRRIICSKCKSLTANPVFDFFLPQTVSCCASCSRASSQNDHLDSQSSSSNSDCVSSTLSCTTSQKKTKGDRRKISRFNSSNSSNDLSSAGCGEVTSSRRRSSRGTTSIMDLKAEGVLVYWCRRLGLPGDRAVRLGRNALTHCWDQMTVLPFRVTLAASLWFGLRFREDRSLYTWQTLKRLEVISGVQATLISAAESKLERALRVVANRKQRRLKSHHLQEGWAESECSS